MSKIISNSENVIMDCLKTREHQNASDINSWQNMPLIHFIVPSAPTKSL